MMRSTFALVAALIGTACAGKPQTTLHVRSGGGCVGVVGFVATISGPAPSDHTELRQMPVLSEDQCALENTISLPGLDVDAPVSVSISGYDSQRFERVHGSTQVLLVDAPGQTALDLVSQWVPSKPVLVVGRSLALGSAALADVTALEVRVTGNQPLLGASVTEEARPFFEAADPFAFTFTGTLAEGQTLTIIVTTAQGQQPPVKATAHDKGAYFEVTLGK